MLTGSQLHSYSPSEVSSPSNPFLWTTKTTSLLLTDTDPFVCLETMSLCILLQLPWNLPSRPDWPQTYRGLCLYLPPTCCDERHNPPHSVIGSMMVRDGSKGLGYLRRLNYSLLQCQASGEIQGKWAFCPTLFNFQLHTGHGIFRAKQTRNYSTSHTNPMAVSWPTWFYVRMLWLSGLCAKAVNIQNMETATMGVLFGLLILIPEPLLF